MPDPNSERVLSFSEHLEELRVRIIICLVFFIVSMIVSFFFAPRIVEWLITPLTSLHKVAEQQVLTFRVGEDGVVRLAGSLTRDAAESEATTMSLANLATNRLNIELPGGNVHRMSLGGKSGSNLYFLSPIEPFMLWLQGALLMSAVVTVPMVIYQMWLFVAPGLVGRERKVVKPLLLASMLLFPLGASFAYWISKFALNVLLGFSYAIPGLEPSIVASKYLNFILMMMLVFGIVFEFPLVLLLLSRIGIIDSAFLVSKRKTAVVLIAVVAAVVTPTPDPFTMLAMLLPLWALYEGSIWAIRLLERAERKERLSVEDSG